jgi:hypothetical protein
MTLVHTTVILQTRQEPLSHRAPFPRRRSVAEGLLCCPDSLVLPGLGWIHDPSRPLCPQPLR